MEDFNIKQNGIECKDAELELLKAGINRSYKERFEMATRLYKIQQTMKKASIQHKPFLGK